MASTANNIFGTISRLRQCRDFQREPMKAVLGRLRWKLRWALTQSPCKLRVGDDIELLAPETGSAGLIYAYGYSEPETIRFLMDFLQDGMVFWDVGAHLGEYSLLASRKVGSTGRVEAFEPQSSIFRYLEHNRSANQSYNVSLHPIAVCQQPGFVDITPNPDPARTFITLSTSIGDNNSGQVKATSLDAFAESQERLPTLIKVDVEGAEHFVLKGATALLGLPAPQAPAWLIEYDPQNCKKFGYHPCLLVDTFQSFGYKTFWVGDKGQLDPSDTPQAFEFGSNLVAIKQPLKARG